METEWDTTRLTALSVFIRTTIHERFRKLRKFFMRLQQTRDHKITNDRSCPPLVLWFRICLFPFEFVSDFESRISDFPVANGKIGSGCARLGPSVIAFAAALTDRGLLLPDRPCFFTPGHS